MGNFCDHQAESVHLQLVTSGIEVEKYLLTNKSTKFSNFSTGSETTKSRNTEYALRKKISKMRKPSARIFTIKREEFSKPIYDPILAGKYDKIPTMGPILIEDSSTYLGQLKNRLRYGFGEMVGADGSMFEGYWDNDKRNGTGRYFMANGDVYDGCWAKDKMHGQGRLYTSDSEYYEGSFEDGAKNGLGKQWLHDLSYYEGTWKQNRKVGEGWFYCSQTKTRKIQVWSLDSTQYT